MARLQLALLALACVLVPAVAATTTARPGDALFAALQRAAAGMKLNATHPRFPSRAGFALPTSCTSKHEAALCGDCVDFMATSALSLLPKNMPCTTPTSFFLTFIKPQVALFERAGGNAAGMLACNVTEIMERVTDRVLPILNCVGTPPPDLRSVVAPLVTAAFAASRTMHALANSTATQQLQHSAMAPKLPLKLAAAQP